jgi:hypothetical protein
MVMMIRFFSDDPNVHSPLRGYVQITGKLVFCHFDRREKSDPPWRVILSNAKDLFAPDRSLSLFGTILRIGFLSPLLEQDSK